jgi:hypothetical protein
MRSFFVAYLSLSFVTQKIAIRGPHGSGCHVQDHQQFEFNISNIKFRTKNWESLKPLPCGQNPDFSPLEH